MPRCTAVPAAASVVALPVMTVKAVYESKGLCHCDSVGQPDVPGIRNESSPNGRLAEEPEGGAFQFPIEASTPKGVVGYCLDAVLSQDK